MEVADLILINTCSIREKAEDTVRKRLRVFDTVKKNRPGTLVGVLGCMAERPKKEVVRTRKISGFSRRSGRLPGIANFGKHRFRW